jgi:hypothetical protein
MEKVTTSNELKEKNQLGKAFFSLIGHILKSIFVIFPLLKLNKTIDLSLQAYTNGIKKLEDFPPEATWFLQQKKINKIVGLISILIVSCGIGFSYYKISNNMFITKGVQKSYEQLKMRNFSEAKRKLQLAQSLSPTFNQDLILVLKVLGLSVLMSYLWGANALHRNPLFKNRQLLKESLEENGLIKKDQNPMILFVPGLGVFIELTGGHTPRSILENNALWSSVGDGIKIGEYVEHPVVRKYVFFKIFYGLKKGDEYGYGNYVSRAK